MAMTTYFMGLRVWNQLLDDYDHDQLADNWAKIDNHDHTPGRGVQLTTQSIAPNSIAENQLIDGSVTEPKLANESVGSGKIQTKSVGTSQLAETSVTGSKLGSGTVRQETSSTQSFLSWGRVSAEGVVEAGTEDFTVVHLGLGKYEIVWTKAKVSGDYAVQVTCVGVISVIGVRAPPTINGFEVNAYFQDIKKSEESLINVPFSFVVLATS